ncbi:MAG TPA: glycosyltransferase [Thermoanaerobaculia bacterium]|nr:glycosyltransferase [Thermoanaerobaculia bacterium]
MRVVHIGKFYPPVLGGIETHLRNLAVGLKDRVDLTVLVASSGRETVRERPEGVDLVRLGQMLQVASAPLVRGIRRELQMARPDIVHLHHPNPFATLAWLSGPVGKLVISYHGDTVRQKLLGRLFLPVLHRALGRASAVIAATRNHVEMSPILSRYAERCHIVPYGIDLETFSSAGQTDVEAIRNKYGPRLVLALGRLVYYKGFEFLVRAMREVEGHLVIIGEGPLQAELEQLVRETGQQEKITILGAVDDIPAWYHAADVFVLPSIAKSEAFGIVQLEAMAARTPVINTSLPSGVPLVSLDGKTGLTVPPSDPDALSAAISRLLDDEPLRRELGEAGYERVRRGFTTEAMVEGTLEVYGKV